MTGNFLPDFRPVVSRGAETTLQCLLRDKAVRATPEERVRQRVLHDGQLGSDEGRARGAGVSRRRTTANRARG